MRHKICGMGLLAVLSLAVLSRGAVQLAAQAQQGTLVHVELLVRTPFGEPVKDLTAEDFVATQAGRRLPVEVVLPRLHAMGAVEPLVPTRMLVIVDGRLADSPGEFDDIVAALGNVRRHGWQVAVARSDGNASGYIAPFPKKMARNWAALGSSSIRTETAVRDMKSFLGRKVVLYVGDAGSDGVRVPRWLRRSARDAMAEVFIVDGGIMPLRVMDAGSDAGMGGRSAEQGPSPYPANASPNSGPSLSGSSPSALSGKEEMFKAGAFHAKDLTNAISKALKDASGYYDVQVNLPTGIQTEAELALRIQRQAPLRGMSQVFAEGAAPKVRVTTE